jgi:hypothetical protein
MDEDTRLEIERRFQDKDHQIADLDCRMQILQAAIVELRKLISKCERKTNPDLIRPIRKV